MAQKTLVIRVPTPARQPLQTRLEGGPFDFRSVPHALFSAKGEGVVATLYRSGKLVIQGAEPELFAARYLAEVPLPAARPEPEVGQGEDGPMIGSDESGKGDYFGPLVVAAVRIGPGDAQRLAQGGVGDSKTLSDETVHRLGPALRETFPHAIRALDPEEYNLAWEETRNLNPLLARLHAEVITELAEPGIRVLVDQFGPERLVKSALGGLDVRLEQRPRAEEEMAVAAASVLARQTFLEHLRALSERFGMDLPKGAGRPVDRAGRRFLEIHGAAELRSVAKLHFRTTQKLSGA